MTNSPETDFYSTRVETSPPTPSGAHLPLISDKLLLASTASNVSAGAPVSIEEKLWMEAKLLAIGVKNGLVDRFHETKEHPRETATEMVSGAAISAALAWTTSRISPIEGRILGGACALAFAGDAAPRLYQAGRAMIDAYNSYGPHDSKNQARQDQLKRLGADQKVIENMLGKGLFDYGLMGLTAYCGLTISELYLNGRMHRSWMRQVYDQKLTDANLIPTLEDGPAGLLVPRVRPRDQEPLGQFYAEHKDLVVQPRVRQVSGGEWSGTGFFVDPEGLLATNYHVVQGAVNRGSDIQIITADGTRYTADMISADRSKDIAILRITDKPDNVQFQSASLGASTMPAADSQVIEIGHPMGIAETVLSYGDHKGYGLNKNGTTYSRFAKPESPEPEETLAMTIRTNAPSMSGNSGSPIFNRQGQVVGIQHSGSGGWMGDKRGFGTTVEHLQALLAETKQQMPIPEESWLDVNTSVVAPETADWVAKLYVNNKMTLPDKLEGVVASSSMRGRDELIADALLAKVIIRYNFFPFPNALLSSAIAAGAGQFGRDFGYAGMQRKRQYDQAFKQAYETALKQGHKSDPGSDASIPDQGHRYNRYRHSASFLAREQADRQHYQIDWPHP